MINNFILILYLFNTFKTNLLPLLKKKKIFFFLSNSE